MSRVVKNKEQATKWPADKVEKRLVSSLIPYARNARTHSDAQVAQIAASITEWGWTMPVLISEDGSIIAGHGRVLAAHLLKLAKVPVVVAKGWTEAQRRAYVIADNKLALNAGWDEHLLASELTDLKVGDFNLDLLGFDPDELKRLTTDPDFSEGSEGGRLDQTADQDPVICPKCGHGFIP